MEDSKLFLQQLVASALQGIISNEETMREITTIIQKNQDKEINFYAVIGEMAVKYAQETNKIFEKSLQEQII